MFFFFFFLLPTCVFHPWNIWLVRLPIYIMIYTYRTARFNSSNPFFSIFLFRLLNGPALNNFPWFLCVCVRRSFEWPYGNWTSRCLLSVESIVSWCFEPVRLLWRLLGYLRSAGKRNLDFESWRHLLHNTPKPTKQQTCLLFCPFGRNAASFFFSLVFSSYVFHKVFLILLIDWAL